MRENNIPIYCSEKDAAFLNIKGLEVHPLKLREVNPFLGGDIELVSCLHGKGMVGKLMAHGVGYYLSNAKEPSLYITGDTMLTDNVAGFILHKRPEVIVLSYGGARFDVGSDIIMGLEEAIAVGKLTVGKIIANHLEALDHCTVTRQQLLEQVTRLGWESRFFVPQSGETITLAAT